MNDPYQVLEIERTADARAIKTAYFRLMRLHPPEGDPGAFQRIREAYDLLSNPERRAQWDAQQQSEQEYGAEAHAVLSASRECMNEGEPGKARNMLERLLETSPEFQEARELLGFALLGLEEPGHALTEFERLVQADPKSVTYRIHVAQTLRVLERNAEATEVARLALELESGNTDAAILLGELLGVGGHWDESFQVWEKAIAAASSAIDALRLRICFVEAHLERHDKEGTEAVLEQLARELDTRDDNDLRRFVADRLSALSAGMFATGSASAGNRLLRASGRFSPSPVFETTLPARVEVLVEDLPEASQQWLSLQVQGLRKRTFWIKPILTVLGGLAILGAGVLILRERSPGPWRDFDTGLYAAFLVASFWLGAGGVDALTRRSKAPRLARLDLIHPLYLLQIFADRLVAWPLLRLVSANLTDHYTNGIFTSTEVRLDFGERDLRIGFPATERARAWAQEVLDARGRALQLLSQGLLACEPGAELIPPGLLAADRARTPTERKRRGRYWRIRAIGLAASAALLALGPVYARWHADRDAASQATTPGQLRRYLREYPSGTHRDEVTRALDRLYANALAKAEKRAGQPLPKVEQLLAALRMDPRLAVEVTGESRLADSDLEVAAVAALLKDAQARDRALADRLRAALSLLVGQELAQYEGGGEVKLGVRYSVALSGDHFVAEGHAASPALQVACTATLSVGGDTLATVNTEGPDAESYTTTNYTLREDPVALQREMILGAMDGCAAGLLARVGASATRLENHPTVLVRRASATDSPYLGTGAGALARGER